MKTFKWSTDKNGFLEEERGITFESVVVSIECGGLLDILAHPNPSRYPGQRILVVAVDGHACLVPFVEEDDCYFLKTIIPSRKATRRYLDQDTPDVDD